MGIPLDEQLPCLTLVAGPAMIVAPYGTLYFSSSRSLSSSTAISPLRFSAISARRRPLTSTSLQSRSSIDATVSACISVSTTARGDAAGVERPHRQLRARLADRLGGDDADRQALLDQLAASTGPCRSSGRRRRAGLAGQRAANPDLLDAERLDRRGDLVGDQLVLADDRLVGDRVDDVSRRCGRRWPRQRTSTSRPCRRAAW